MDKRLQTKTKIIRKLILRQKIIKYDDKNQSKSSKKKKNQKNKINKKNNNHNKLMGLIKFKVKFKITPKFPIKKDN
jgi:hypothetical protein